MKTNTTAAKKTATPASRPLSKGIRASDLKYPKHEDCDPDANRRLGAALGGTYAHSFEIWFTEGAGWVIPVLKISNARTSGGTRREYSICIEDGKIWCVGRGPHVLETKTVYISNKNIDRLEKFIEILAKGCLAANAIRDRISTRRARTQELRSQRGWW